MKKKVDLARAWRDQDYYLSLTDDERASLGAHPAGVLALDDAALKSITGGDCTCDCCQTQNCTAADCETVNTTAVCSVCPPYYCE